MHISGWHGQCCATKASNMPSRSASTLSRLLTRSCWVLALVAQPLSARAEEPKVETVTPPARKMTLAEAKAYARGHQLRLLASRQRLAAIGKDSEVVGGQWLPRAGAMAEILGATTNNSTTTLLNTSAVDLPRIGSTRVSNTYDMAPYASTAVAVGIRQQLYDFGRIAAEQAAAEQAVRVERARIDNVALDVDLAVEQGYFAVLAASAVADASQNAFERAGTHRDFARANVASGMRPPIEQTRAEADLARYEANLVRANGSLQIARSTFAALVGVDDVELDAVAPSHDEMTAPLPSLTEALSRGAATAVAAESRDRVEAQRAETRRIEAQTRPSLFATAAVNARAGGATPSSGPVPTGSGLVPIVPNYDVGVVLSWSFLDFTNGRRVDASRERERALELEEASTLRATRAVITASWREAEVARRTLSALERGSIAAKANYDQADNRFKVGLGTSTELADAQALRTDADIQLAIGRFRMASARAALSRNIAQSSQGGL